MSRVFRTRTMRVVILAVAAFGAAGVLIWRFPAASDAGRGSEPASTRRNAPNMEASGEVMTAASTTGRIPGLPNPQNRNTVRRLCRMITTRGIDEASGGFTAEFVLLWELTAAEREQCRQVYEAFFEEYCQFELASSRLVEQNGYWIELLPVEGVSNLNDKLESDFIGILGPSRGLAASAMLTGALRNGGSTRMKISYIQLDGEETSYRHVCTLSPEGIVMSTIQAYPVNDVSFGKTTRWRHLDQFLTGEH